jgi:hypothetical protein
MNSARHFVVLALAGSAFELLHRTLCAGLSLGATDTALRRRLNDGWPGRVGRAAGY